MSAMPIILVLTFLDTGAVQQYGFDSMANCRAIIPATAQLYKALKQPVTLECLVVPKPTKPAPIEHSYKQGIKYNVSYKF